MPILYHWNGNIDNLSTLMWLIPPAVVQKILLLKKTKISWHWRYFRLRLFLIWEHKVNCSMSCSDVADFRHVVSLETHTQMTTYQNRIVTIPGTPPFHPDAFKRPNTLPMCGLSWRKPGIGGHLCMEPHVRPSALLKPNYIKHMLNIPKSTPSIHPDAFERWGRLPICSFSGGTAMHWRPSVHETYMCGCPPYWIPINMRQFMPNTGLTTREACLLSIQMHVEYGREF